jgi:DNA uptake protein ComE-like DNA-binding protein
VSYDDLFDVCVKYIGNGYYVGEAIPQKKLTNARSSFAIPDTERVIALLDTTVFGSSKDGLAVCTGGVYWHDFMTDPKKLTWADFASANIKPKGNRDLEIGEDNGFQPAVAMDKDDALRLFSEIQMLIRSSSTARGATGNPMSTRVRKKVETHPSHRPTGRSATQATSRLDLNHAPVDDLLSLPAISLPNSQKLVRERELRAGFKTVEEVGHFLGLQPHEVERLKQRVTVEPYSGPRPSGGRVIDY